MSADNWTTCPECRRLKDAKRQKLIKKAEEAYGKVSAAEYQRLLAEARVAVAPGTDEPEDNTTLREDYEIGVNTDGVLEISYGCSCRECGFSFSYKNEVEAKNQKEKK